MNTISFMTANYVARQVGYHMTEGWMQGDNATQAHFRGVETFGARFEEYLRDIQAMGFAALDLWLAILHPDWATDEHLDIAVPLLKKYQMRVTSLAGSFGTTREAFNAACNLAEAVGTTLLGGTTKLLQTDRAYVIGTLCERDLKLGIENHPEKHPHEVLAQIGKDSKGVLGTALDTGWYGTQGFDAAAAIEHLRDYVLLVHLKDVRAAGTHETCRLGAGCVPIKRCVETIRQIGYAGAISIEHEPELFDPTEDVKASLKLLKGWLQA
jgi:sugar phosphate isomerase/epimerase